jgi:hypothetical protein
MLSVCAEAGLSPDSVLADDTPTPVRLGSVFALATDDIMHFARGHKAAAVQKAAKLDKAFLAQGIRKHPAKDVTGELEGTCIGIDLEEGMYWAPHKPKLRTLLAGLKQAVTDPVISPLGMSALLGHVQ